LLVVSESGSKNVKDRLFVKVKLDGGLMDYMNENVEAGGGRVKGARVKGVATLIIVIVLEIIDISGHGGRGLWKQGR
jgi:hypothetical protein